MTATIPQGQWYEVRVVDPTLDEDMGKLASRLGRNRAQVFHNAMRLYIAMKNRQLDRAMESNSPPFHILLDDKQGRKIEFIDP